MSININNNKFISRIEIILKYRPGKPVPWNFAFVTAQYQPFRPMRSFGRTLRPNRPHVKGKIRENLIPW